MRFLVDAQLSPALARWAEGHGHLAEHVADVGLTSADDRAIWEYLLEWLAALLPAILDALERGEVLVEVT